MNAGRLAAIRALKIPLGDVLASPTYRATETVRFARLSQAVPVAERDHPRRENQDRGLAAAALTLALNVRDISFTL
jgi:hypothetical protein